MKVITCGVYKITSPTNKCYIGQSKNIEYRFSKYRLLSGGLMGQKRLFRSLKKHGWEKHKFEIIHVCAEEELNKLERYYIELFNTFNTKHGLNLTNGGDSHKMSNETRKKISNANKKRGNDWKEKIRISKIGNKNMLGKRHTDKTIQKIKDSKTGKKASEETRKRMSESQKKRERRSDEFRLKMSIINKGSKNWMTNPKFRGYVKILRDEQSNHV